MGAIAGVSDWLFRDRATGKIVIGQFPNLPLILWLVATVLAAVTSGTVSTLAGYAATLALVVWGGGRAAARGQSVPPDPGRDCPRLGAGLPDPGRLTTA